MADPLETKVVALNPHELVGLENAQGRCVCVLRGTVWITQSDDRRDIVLEAGQSFVLDRPGLALIHALTASALTLDSGLQRPCEPLRIPARRTAALDPPRDRSAASL